MSAKKNPQQAQEPKQEQARTYICPACVKNEKTKGLMCPDCYTTYQKDVVRRIKKHQPVMFPLGFALQRARQNLDELTEKQAAKREETTVFFGEAHRQVTIELRGVGRLSDREFLECVMERYREIMIGAGKEELYRESEQLKKTVFSLKSQISWMEKLEFNQSDRSEEETGTRATKDVSETTAVA
ncbi:MAG: hypothetical protein Q8N58_02565 [bacterium]|nr:hypothetical protein [bacterium]